MNSTYEYIVERALEPWDHRSSIPQVRLQSPAVHVNRDDDGGVSPLSTVSSADFGRLPTSKVTVFRRWRG